MNGITITKQSGDYHACITGMPSMWGCGITPDEAIISLVAAVNEQAEAFKALLVECETEFVGMVNDGFEDPKQEVAVRGLIARIREALKGK